MNCSNSRLRLLIVSLPTLLASLSLFVSSPLAADSRDDQRRDEQYRDERYRDQMREERRRDEERRDTQYRDERRNEERQAASHTNLKQSDRTVKPVRNLHPELQIASPRDSED